MGLFDPIWKTDKTGKEAKAVASVQKISDPEQLRKIASTAPLAAVQRAAVERIDDQRILLDLALDRSPGIRNETRQAAVERISDQTVLTELALHPAYTGSSAAERVTDPELLFRIAMSGTANERAREAAVFRIKDNGKLAEIARSAPGPRRDGPGGLNAKKKAADLITDVDILIGLTSDPDRTLRGSAWSSLNHILSRKEHPGPTPEQESRMAASILRENDPKMPLLRLPVTDPDLLERISQDAVRDDLRAKAFSQIVMREDYPRARLIEACKTIIANQNAFPNAGWGRIHDEYHHLILSSKGSDPELMLAFVKDAETGPLFGSDCLYKLFAEDNRAHPGIEAMQKEGAAAFLANIPAYGRMSALWDEKNCIRYFAEAIPKDRHEEYSLRVVTDEYTYPEGLSEISQTITFRGKTYHF